MRIAGIKEIGMPIKPPKCKYNVSPHARTYVCTYVRTQHNATQPDATQRNTTQGPFADGQRMVTASADETAKVWEANTGQELFTMTGHDGWVFSAAYSADGQRIVTGGRDKTAKVWGANTGTELLTIRCPSAL